MVGAAALAAKGALRSGAGLVTVGTAEAVEPILAAKLECAMTLPLPSVDSSIAATALPVALQKAAEMDCIGTGPGLGRHPDTMKFMAGLLRDLDKPLVLDADGLNLISGTLRRDLLGYAHPVILTPHPGEMARLLDLSIQAVQKNRKATAIRAAKDFQAIVVLKGADTVITDGACVHINQTGNPGMATGGAGDVLTGIITALVGQGLSAFDAARLGVHVHGLAGDLAAERFGQVSMTATDIADHLAAAFLTLEEKR